MFSACYTAVYGHLCGQKRFPLKADDDSTVLSGKRFAFSGLLHCNSVREVILAQQNAMQEAEKLGIEFTPADSEQSA